MRYGIPFRIAQRCHYNVADRRAEVENEPCLAMSAFDPKRTSDIHIACGAGLRI